MPIWLRIGLLSAIGFSLGFAGIYAFMNEGQNAAADTDGKPRELDWAALRELDINTGKMSSVLKEADGRKVKIPGFMIPLEDNQSNVTEFLLVPSPMACIHTPPPPANQMVTVRMAGGRKTEMTYGPVWAQGRLRISDVQGPYGKSSYELLGEVILPYQ
ncbi:MAG: hypothetical protein RL189_64 [Pseudomonadota bacterium]|jgi:hypothetical protein